MRAIGIAVWAALAFGTTARAAEPAPTEAFERRVRAAVEKAMPAVVAVEIGTPQPKRGHYESFGSGVVITPDGLVLSQHHVTHAADPNDPSKIHPPGRATRVIFPDGREAKAELLGTDPAADLSLLKLLGDGPFPHTPLDPKTAVAVGDGVLKLGHPLGYRAGRPPVVRLGRVLRLDPDHFVSDCPVVGGDSGGPFFDLDGRLVGIITGSAGGDGLFAARADVPRAGMVPGALGAAAVAARLDGLRKGETTGRPPRDQSNADVLPAAKWSQGSATLAGWREVVAGGRTGVVTVLDGDEPAALGTVVEPGLVVTKASTLPPEPRCRVAGGTVVPAEVLGGDAAWDLALLRVPADGLKPVEWADGAGGPAGSLLAAVGPGEGPLAAGVVAVPRRKLDGKPPARIVPAPPAPAARPEAIGSPVEGRGYWVEYVEGRLADAGAKPGDVLLSIAGVPTRAHADLPAAVRGRRPGQRVPVRVQRGRQVLDLTLTLRPDPISLRGGREDDFPEVVEHDLPVQANELGGPLVDRHGRAVGVTVGAGPVGGLLVPADRVREVVAALRTGDKPWPGDRKPPAAAKPAAEEPVALTVDEVKVKLKERADRFKAVLVEYDTRVEAEVEPARLVAWGGVFVRDYRERRTAAFAGDKRLSRVLVPGDQPRWLPDEEVRAEPGSPPDVVRRVEQAARTAAARRDQGDPARLVAIRSANDDRSLFDGAKAYRSSGRVKRFAPVPAEEFQGYSEYLAGLGLQPFDPKPSADRRKEQERLRLPDALGRLAKARVRPETEAVDGAVCVVVEGEADGEAERVWLDPKLGWSPRRWERTAGGRLVVRYTFGEWEEFAPGCWLPWEGALGVGPPGWAADAPAGPAHTVRMRLRRATVGDLPAGLFQP